MTFPVGSNEPGTIVVRVPRGESVAKNRILSGYTSTAAKDAVPNNFKQWS